MNRQLRSEFLKTCNAFERIIALFGRTPKDFFRQLKKVFPTKYETLKLNLLENLYTNSKAAPNEGDYNKLVSITQRIESKLVKNISAEEKEILERSIENLKKKQGDTFISNLKEVILSAWKRESCLRELYPDVPQKINTATSGGTSYYKIFLIGPILVICGGLLALSHAIVMYGQDGYSIEIKELLGYAALMLGSGSALLALGQRKK